MTLPKRGDDEETMDVDNTEDNEPEPKAKVYLPHKHGQGSSNTQGGVDPDELVMEESAYRFYYSLGAECSSLSFDYLQGGNAPAALALVTQETGAMTYPLSVYFVSGSQAQNQHNNSLTVVRMSNIWGKTNADGEQESSSSSSDEDSDDEDTHAERNDGAKGFGGKKAHLMYTTVPHSGTVNRVRVSRRSLDTDERQLAATWSELGAVHLWNLQPVVTALDQPRGTTGATPATAHSTITSSAANTERVDLAPSVLEAVKNPLFTYRPVSLKSNSRGPVEGYALDWATAQPGWLASGDVNGSIQVWQPQSSASGSSWQVSTPLQQGHTDSVEDIQWAPSQPNVLISCSCDASILVWDLRQGGRPAIRIAHASLKAAVDINVISWNRVNESLLVSGDDAGSVRLWDLRRINEKQRSGSAPNLNTCFLHEYLYHKAAITSIEWHPSEAHTFACSSEDDQVTLWDCSVEQAAAGDVAMDKDPDLRELPPQMLFIHMGQKEVKEVHWHPKHAGLIMSTSLDGYNVFRTINV